VFVGGTGEEALGAGAGADNGTDGGRRKDSNTVTGPYGKKYETEFKEHDICRHNTSCWEDCNTSILFEF